MSSREPDAGCSRATTSQLPSVSSSIEALPVEILLKIFNYFEPDYLVHTIAKVCKRFTTILKDEEYWRVMYYGLMNDYHKFNKFPILEQYGVLEEVWRCEPNVFWKDLTLRLKKLHDMWSKSNNFLTLHSSTTTVDAVHILQNGNICLTGSREKCIDLWAIDDRPYVKTSVVDAHGDDINCLQSFEEDHFLSGSTDKTVSYWNIRSTSCECLWNFNCGKAVMSLAARPGLVIAGLHGQQIALIDPRVRQPLNSIVHTINDKPLVKVALKDDYVLSVGRNYTLCAFDLRRQAVVDQIEFRNLRHGAPLSMAVRNNIAYVGDSKGYVYLFHVGYAFVMFQQIVINPQEIRGPFPQDYKINSICPELGAIIVGCSDRTVQVVVPTEPLYRMKVVNVNSEVTSMSYRKSILAVGRIGGAVDIFKADLQGTLILDPLIPD